MTKRSDLVARCKQLGIISAPSESLDVLREKIALATEVKSYGTPIGYSDTIATLRKKAEAGRAAKMKTVPKQIQRADELEVDVSRTDSPAQLAEEIKKAEAQQAIGGTINVKDRNELERLAVEFGIFVDDGLDHTAKSDEKLKYEIAIRRNALNQWLALNNEERDALLAKANNPNPFGVWLTPEEREVAAAGSRWRDKMLTDNYGFNPELAAVAGLLVGGALAAGSGLPATGAGAVGNLAGVVTDGLAADGATVAMQEAAKDKAGILLSLGVGIDEIQSAIRGATTLVEIAERVKRYFAPAVAEIILQQFGIINTGPGLMRGQGITGAGPVYPEDVYSVTRLTPVDQPEFLRPAPEPSYTRAGQGLLVPEQPAVFKLMKRDVQPDKMPDPAKTVVATMPKKKGKMQSPAAKAPKKAPTSMSRSGKAITNPWIIHVKATWEQMKKDDPKARYSEAVKTAKVTWPAVKDKSARISDNAAN